MRVVRDSAELPAQVEAARREAQSAFGDPTVFCEQLRSPPATTSRSRCSPTSTAPCGRSANANAPSSGATRRSSKRRRRRWSSAHRAMRAKLFDAARLAATRDRLRSARAPSSSWPTEHGRLLLPRDEHPAAGRASRHRGDSPGWTSSSCSCRSPTAAWLDSEPPPSRGSFDRGTAVRRGSGQGLAAAGRHRAPLRGARATVRRRHRVRGRLGLRTSVVGVLRPDAGQGHLIGPHPRARPRACLADALARTRTARHRTNRDLLVNVLRTRRSSTAPPTPRSSTPTAWPSLAAPLARSSGGRARSPRWPPRWPMPPGTAARRNGFRSDAQRVAQPGAPATRHRNVSTATAPDDEYEVAVPLRRAAGSELPDCRRRGRSRRAPATRSVLVPSMAWSGLFDVARYGADVYVDWPAGTRSPGWSLLFASPIRIAALAIGRCWRRCRASVMPHRRVGRRSGRRAGQPLIWLEAMKMEHTVTAPERRRARRTATSTAGQQVDVGRRTSPV